MPDTPSTQAAVDGLAPISGPDGTLAIVAMGQRHTLRRMLTAENRPTDPDTISSFKVDVTDALSPAASAVLLDPEFGVAVRDAGATASSSSSRCARTGRGGRASRTWWRRSSRSCRPWSTIAPPRASRR